jgi:hypothetical protein
MGYLSNINLEERVIGMVVAPSEIFLPLMAIYSVELPIVAMPLTQVKPVSAIFVAIVDVIVPAIPIVVTLFMVVVRPRHRDQEGGAKQESAENKSMLHVFETSVETMQLAGPSPVLRSP